MRQKLKKMINDTVTCKLQTRADKRIIFEQKFKSEGIKLKVFTETATPDFTFLPSRNLSEVSVRSAFFADSHPSGFIRASQS